MLDLKINPDLKMCARSKMSGLKNEPDSNIMPQKEK